MSINDWIEQNFTHITLDTTIMGANGTLLSVPKLNVDLTIGLISTNNKEEFSKLALHYAPLGTIVEPLEDEWYETHILLVRNLLTEKLLKDPRARHYLDILSRRDADHWQDTSKQKQTSVKATTNQGINLEFSIV